MKSKKVLQFEEDLEVMEDRTERPSRVLPQWSQYCHPNHQHHQHNYQNGSAYARTVQPRHSITENCDLVCKVRVFGFLNFNYLLKYVHKSLVSFRLMLS